MKYQILSGVNILKPADGSDCTNRGNSSFHTRATLLVPENVIQGTFEPIELLGGLHEIEIDTLPDPIFILRKRIIAGFPYFNVAPTDYTHKSYSFGGNFLYYCGNGFRSICQYPIPIHDRHE